MYETLKDTVKHTAVYGLGNILSKFVGFLMIPVYTRYLTPEDYGTVELLFLTVSILSIILSVGIERAVLRYFFDSDELSERKKVISSAHFFILGTATLTVLILWPLADFFSEVILGYKEGAFYFRLIFLILLCDVAVIVPLAFIRAEHRSALYISSAIGRLILVLALNIYWVVFAGRKVDGVLYANLTGSAVVSLFLIAYTLRKVGFRFSLPKLRAMLVFGLPLVPASIGMFSLTYADRYFLKAYTDIHTVGLYALGYKFGILLSFLITQPFLLMWSAQMFEVAKRPDARFIYRRYVTYFSFVFLFSGLALSLLVREIIAVMADPAYYEAHTVVPILVLGYYFVGIRYQFEVSMLLKNKTIYLSAILLGSAAVNLFLNALFIRFYGMMGAAIATTLSFLGLAIATLLVGRRVYPISYEFSRLAKLLLTTITLFCLGYAIPQGSLVLAIAIKLGLVLAFPFVLGGLGFFEEEEKQRIRRALALAFSR